MNFNLNEEQHLIKDSLRKLLNDHYSFAGRQQAIKDNRGFNRDIWNKLSELGLLAITCPEAQGGLGGNAVDVALICEELGRSLVLEPYLASSVLASSIIQKSSEQWQAKLLPALLEGAAIASLAYLEAQSQDTTRAVAEGDQFILNGKKFMVLAAPQADYFLLTATLSGHATPDTLPDTKPHTSPAQNSSIFIMSKDSPGLTVHPYQLIDGRPAANLTLSNVKIPADNLLIDAKHTPAVMEEIINTAIVGLCAEAVGCMNAVIDRTVTYTKSRKQFGVTLSSFQVIQDRLASMYMQYQQAQPLVYAAAAKMADQSDDKSMTVSAAKAFTDQAGLFIGQNAVQLHGGLGVTEELDVGHYFKRLTAIQQMFGTRIEHLRRYADLSFADINDHVAA
jgi:alkylation response protein AidB-like acyl-CoA dehydrogenase